MPRHGVGLMEAQEVSPLEAAAVLREFALLNLGPQLKEAIAVAAQDIEDRHKYHVPMVMTPGREP